MLDCIQFGYGEKYRDIWGQIQEKFNSGWFVPSLIEWVIFAEELDIEKENYADKGLSSHYWTSSQSDSKNVIVVQYNYGFMSYSWYPYATYRVRLSTTF